MRYLVDTHAHLTDPRLCEEVEGVVAAARDAGVHWLVSVASDADDARRALELTSRFDCVYATAGVHPHVADGADEETFERIRELARNDRVVAIGETGLDFHYDNSARENQRSSFARHLALAAELDLPAVVHSRNADVETADLLGEAGWGRGVLHCFSGGRDLLDRALDLGWYVSFAGMITFPRWDGADLLRRVPLDRLLVETDSPYLAPVPHRGRRNEPAYVRIIAERAAAIRGEEPGRLIDATTANAHALYGVAR